MKIERADKTNITTMNPIPQNNNICPMGIWSGIADDAKNINYPFFLLKIVVSTFCRICIFSARLDGNAP